MSEPKIKEFFENCGIFISQLTISRILTNDETGFNKEKKDISLAILCGGQEDRQFPFSIKTALSTHQALVIY